MVRCAGGGKISSQIQSELINVVKIYSNSRGSSKGGAFATLRSDGTVRAWGGVCSSSGETCEDDDAGAQAASGGQAPNCAALKAYCKAPTPTHMPTSEGSRDACKDDDKCLQAKPTWEGYTCAGSTKYCSSYASDMECCKKSCETCEAPEIWDKVKNYCPETCGVCSCETDESYSMQQN